MKKKKSKFKIWGHLILPFLLSAVISEIFLWIILGNIILEHNLLVFELLKEVPTIYLFLIPLLIGIILICKIFHSEKKIMHLASLPIFLVITNIAFIAILSLPTTEDNWEAAIFILAPVFHILLFSIIFWLIMYNMFPIPQKFKKLRYYYTSIVTLCFLIYTLWLWHFRFTYS